MDIVMSPEEVRVLGCLIEKEVTTPDYYPLTLNALVVACNQKTNRHPVVEYDEKTVLRTLDRLREKKLAILHHVAGSRVPKYEHRLLEHFPFSEEQRGLICLLLLRGPQTAGELKGRSGRLCSFASVTEVEHILGTLAGHELGPFVVELPLQPGSREPRYMHLFGGMPELPADLPLPVEPARRQLEAEDNRIAALEATVEDLRRELADLREAFAQFRTQFE